MAVARTVAAQTDVLVCRVRLVACVHVASPLISSRCRPRKLLLLRQQRTARKTVGRGKSRLSSRSRCKSRKPNRMQKGVSPSQAIVSVGRRASYSSQTGAVPMAVVRMAAVPTVALASRPGHAVSAAMVCVGRAQSGSSMTQLLLLEALTMYGRL